MRQCQFQVWHPKMGPKHVGKAKSIRLSTAFGEYLKQDETMRASDECRLFGRRGSHSSSESTSGGLGGEEEQDGLQNFRDVTSAIDKAIEELGGAVVPRLNWSCPKDATWLNPWKTLKCTNADEIILMLKASDRVSNDLCHAFDICVDFDPDNKPEVDFVLNLRKWYDFDKSRELRCFVVHKRLIGVSQRYLSENATALAENEDDIIHALERFFRESVAPKIDLESYAFDVHLTRDGRITLIDVSPAGDATNPLLFTWDELVKKSAQPEHKVEMRISSSEHSSALVSERAVYGFPYDFVDHESQMEVKDILDKINGQMQEEQIQEE